MTDTKPHPHLPVAEGHHLVIAESAGGSQDAAANIDDRRYDELTAAGEKVASFHVWQEADEADPTVLHKRWTKTDASGKQIDRGSLIG